MSSILLSRNSSSDHRTWTSILRSKSHPIATSEYTQIKFALSVRLNLARTIIAGTEDACLSVQPEDGPVGPFKKAPNTNQQNADFSQWPGGLTGLLATRPQPPAEQFGRFTRLRSRQPQLWLDGSNFQLTDESLFSAVGKWGCDGEPGGEPQPGAAGGQILLRLDSLPKKNPTGFILTLSAKGGTGGRGHDGQNGAPGESGSDVYLKGIVRGKVLKAAPVREFLDAAGRIPGKSGNGGDARVSGQGGRGGSVNVSIRDWSGSNLDHLIRICIDPGEPGPSGTPGQPGTTEPDHFARFVRNISFVYREWVEYLKYLGTPVDYSLTQRLQSFFAAHTRAGTLPRPEPGKPGATEMASGAHTPTYVADYFPTTLLDKLYQRARLQVLMADPLGGDEEALSGVALTRATDTLHWLTSVLEPIKDRKDAKYIRHVLLYHEANALYPGFPFWPSWNVYDSRLPAAMQRFSHCCQVRYSFRCRYGLRMLADHGVPAKPEGPLATPLPRRPSATRVRWLFRAVDVTLRAQVAPKSAAACRRTTSGSDAPPQAATNNIARASRAVRPSSSADAASSSATSF